MSMFPVVAVAVAGAIATFGLLFELDKHGLADVMWNLRRESDTGASVMFYFPNANFTQADMDVANGMTARPNPNWTNGNNALFQNDAANFSAEGNITGLKTTRAHGVMHGSIFVPMGEANEVVHGKWIHVNSELVGQDKIDAFSALEEASQNIQHQRKGFMDIFDIVTAEEATES